MFQTYGDVTFDNFLRSVSCMAGDNDLTMILAVREVTDKMQRTIQRYQDRGWITSARLLIGDVNGEVIAFKGTQGMVIIQGPVIDTRLTTAVPQLYAGQFTSDPKSAPLIALLSARYQRAQQASTPEVPASDKKTTRKTRKTKQNDEKPTEKMA